MALALPGVRHNPDAKPTNRSLWLTFHDEHQERFRKLGNITLEGVKNSSKGSGATPAGSLARPHGTSTNKKSLYPSASARIETRGLLSRVSARDTLTNAHEESTRTKNRGPRLDAPRSHARLSTSIASNTERAPCKSTRARPNGDRRIRKQALTNRKASSARTPPAA